MLCFVGFSSFSQVKCAISGKHHTSISTVTFVSEVKSMVVVCHQGTTALERHLLEATSSKKKYHFSNYCEMSWQVKSIFLKYWASLYLSLSSILSCPRGFCM